MGTSEERYYLVIKDDSIEVYNDWAICLRYITRVENQHYKITDKNCLLEKVSSFYLHGKILVVHFKGCKRNDYISPDDFAEFLEVYKAS